MGKRTLLVRANHPSFTIFGLVLLGAVTGCGGDADAPKQSPAAAGAGGSSSNPKASTARGGSATGTTSSTQPTSASGGASSGGAATTLGSGGAVVTAVAQGGSTVTTVKTSTGGSGIAGTTAKSSATAGGQTASPAGGQTSGQSGGQGGSAKGGASANSAAGRSASGGTVGGTPAVGGSSLQGGTSSTATSNQATQAFVTTYANPYCTKLADCCTKAGFSAPSTSACAANELSFYEKSLLDGTATLDSAAVQTLLTAVQSTCDQPSYTLYSNLTKGTLPEGSSCTDVSQCAGDSVICGLAGSANTGTCTALSRGKLGSTCAIDCDNTNSSCRWTMSAPDPGATVCWDEDGLRCDDTTKTCVALSGIGKACDFDTCGVHADCYNGTCRAKGKLNESCADGRSCESTLICDSNTQKCVKMSIAWSGSCEP